MILRMFVKLYIHFSSFEPSRIWLKHWTIPLTQDKLLWILLAIWLPWMKQQPWPPIKAVKLNTSESSLWVWSSPIPILILLGFLMPNLKSLLVIWKKLERSFEKAVNIVPRVRTHGENSFVCKLLKRSAKWQSMPFVMFRRLSISGWMYFFSLFISSRLDCCHWNHSWKETSRASQGFGIHSEFVDLVAGCH